MRHVDSLQNLLIIYPFKIYYSIKVMQLVFRIEPLTCAHIGYFLRFYYQTLHIVRKFQGLS